MLWLAAGMAAASALSSIAGGNAQNAAVAAQNAAIQENIRSNTLEANYMVAEATRQQQEVVDQATSNLVELRIQQMEAEGAVQAASGETGVSGNSINTSTRSAMSQYGRSAASIMDNVDRELMALHSQKEATVKNVNQRNKAMAMGYSSGVSKGQQFLGAVASGVQGYAAGASLANSFDGLLNNKSSLGKKLKIPK
ncbi:virion core protein, T7 gp14 family [Chromobacterium amazonense]|uniref:virion core protein, T7 gp14 family n=1 Tax=Chromobacterium amazonense TaxID=1382803 RepID=UPI0011B1FB73|nr:hypothetical protein [Chromobacterium amazonense]